jgi:hypothetical protein
LWCCKKNQNNLGNLAKLKCNQYHKVACLTRAGHGLLDEYGKIWGSNINDAKASEWPHWTSAETWSVVYVDGLHTSQHSWAIFL